MPMAMNTLVAGAAGRTGAHVLRLLLAANVGPVRGLVRRQEQAGAVAAFGADPVVVDIREDLSATLSRVEAVVSAIGAGHSGDPDAEDYRPTAHLVEAAEAAGVERFVLISSMGTTAIDRMPAALRPYLEAKRKAEERLQASSMRWTIIRPGGLTDEPGTERVQIATSLPEGGKVAREDVARVTVRALLMPATEGLAFDVVAGDRTIAEALGALVAV